MYGSPLRMILQTIFPGKAWLWRPSAQARSAEASAGESAWRETCAKDGDFKGSFSGSLIYSMFRSCFYLREVWETQIYGGYNSPMAVLFGLGAVDVKRL